MCREHIETKAVDEILTVGELVAKLGSKNEGVNLLEIEKYLRASRIARKISGYCDKIEEKEAKKSDDIFS